MESFVHLRKGRTPRRLHADLDGLKDDELGRGGFTGWIAADFDREAAMLDALALHESRSLLWNSGCARGVTIRTRSSRLDLLRSCDLGIGRPHRRYESAG